MRLFLRNEIKKLEAGSLLALGNAFMRLKGLLFIMKPKTYSSAARHDYVTITRLACKGCARTSSAECTGNNRYAMACCIENCAAFIISGQMQVIHASSDYPSCMKVQFGHSPFHFRADFPTHQVTKIR